MSIANIPDEILNKIVSNSDILTQHMFISSSKTIKRRVYPEIIEKTNERISLVKKIFCYAQKKMECISKEKLICFVNEVYDSYVINGKYPRYTINDIYSSMYELIHFDEGYIVDHSKYTTFLIDMCIIKPEVFSNTKISTGDYIYIIKKSKNDEVKNLIINKSKKTYKNIKSMKYIKYIDYFTPSVFNKDFFVDEMVSNYALLNKIRERITNELFIECFINTFSSISLQRVYQINRLEYIYKKFIAYFMYNFKGDERDEYMLVFHEGIKRSSLLKVEFLDLVCKDDKTSPLYETYKKMRKNK